MRKVPLLLMITAVVAGSFVLLPSYLKQRYFTFLSADTAQIANEREREMIEGADVGSSQARLTLLINSIEMTAAHPLFGVGPGQFPYQAWQRRKQLGLATIYNETHNTYTQISSDLGVPGLVIFLGLLFSCIRAVRSVTRLRSSPLYRLPPQVLDTADTLLLGLVVLCVCASFLSLAYGPLFFVMPAIIAAFYRAVQNALPSWRVVPLTPPAQPILQKPAAGKIPRLAGAGLMGRVSFPK